jgi:hypothetical protein
MNRTRPEYVRFYPEKSERGIDPDRIARIARKGGHLSPVEQEYLQRKHFKLFAMWKKVMGL